MRPADQNPVLVTEFEVCKESSRHRKYYTLYVDHTAGVVKGHIDKFNVYVRIDDFLLSIMTEYKNRKKDENSGSISFNRFKFVLTPNNNNSNPNADIYDSRFFILSDSYTLMYCTKKKKDVLLVLPFTFIDLYYEFDMEEILSKIMISKLMG